jgi:hypothetical protein
MAERKLPSRSFGKSSTLLHGHTLDLQMQVTNNRIIFRL